MTDLPIHASVAGGESPQSIRFLANRSMKPALSFFLLPKSRRFNILK